MDRREFLKSGAFFGTVLSVAGLSLASACASESVAVVKPNETSPVEVSTDDLPFKKVIKTDAEWKKILTREQYEITRQAGTEAPYTSLLNDIHDKGTFTCVCCDLPLFSSETKFDSHTGWPSFYATIKKVNVKEKVDKSLMETRTEVLCNRCDAHLGHVFDDGPKPTGLRYCMNGAAMKFVKA